MLRKTHEKKYQSLKKADDFYRAEIKLGKFDLVYQLKLRDLNGSVACFLIKQDSAIFNKLKVGKVLEMKYWSGGKTKIIKFVKAKVKNITKQNQELLNGHYLVYLSIPERLRSGYDRRNCIDQRRKQEQLYAQN